MLSFLTKEVCREDLQEVHISYSFLAVEQKKAPAKISDGGTSYIISYYDEHLRYVCTIHRIVTKRGKVIHEHVKDAFIDGVRYKAKTIHKGG